MKKASETDTEAGKQNLKQKQELMKKDMKNTKEPEKKKEMNKESETDTEAGKQKFKLLFLKKFSDFSL